MTNKQINKETGLEFSMRVCKNCGKTFFSFYEQNLNRACEAHMMRTGHIVVDEEAV